MSDAGGRVCTPASLGLDGPITITYTASDAERDTRFTHWSAAPER